MRAKTIAAAAVLDDDDREFLRSTLAGCRVAPAALPDDRATKIALEAAIRRMATEE